MSQVDLEPEAKQKLLSRGDEASSREAEEQSWVGPGSSFSEAQNPNAGSARLLEVRGAGAMLHGALRLWRRVLPALSALFSTSLRVCIFFPNTFHLGWTLSALEHNGSRHAAINLLRVTYTVSSTFYFMTLLPRHGSPPALFAFLAV